MDPYNVLGVSKDCDSSEIKKAYRKLSLQFHPDRNPLEEAKTKILEINSAYEKIGDPESRKHHDEEIQNLFTRGGFPGFSGETGAEFMDINNIFSMMFNQRGMGGGPGVQVFHSGGGQNQFFHQQNNSHPYDSNYYSNPNQYFSVDFVDSAYSN